MTQPREPLTHNMPVSYILIGMGIGLLALLCCLPCFIVLI